MKKLNLTILAIAMFATLGFSQNLAQIDSVSTLIRNRDIVRRHSIGSSLFLLGNLAPGDPVYFFQLNYGYRLTPKDNIIWKLSPGLIMSP